MLTFKQMLKRILKNDKRKLSWHDWLILMLSP